MAICKINIDKAVRLIGREHTAIIVRLAQSQDKLESYWDGEIERVNEEISALISQNLPNLVKFNIPDELFERLMLANYFQSVAAAVTSTETELEFINKSVGLARMGSPPKMPKLPRSLAEIRILYDKYRRRRSLPKRIKEMAESVKKQYLKKVKTTWRKYSEDFRSGNVATQEEAVKKIKEAADTVVSRAKTIVRTETTNYYNQTRIEIYNQTDAVTHYLFLAIRDQATTFWCSEKVHNGKRGRHGLVYRKGDPLTIRETPSCHWNCRSEMVPLTPYNPRHLKLIEDESMHRRNHTCYPLPEGWR